MEKFKSKMVVTQERERENKNNKKNSDPPGKYAPPQIRPKHKSSQNTIQDGGGHKRKSAAPTPTHHPPWSWALGLLYDNCK